jgi:hypothetical protein
MANTGGFLNGRTIVPPIAPIKEESGWIRYGHLSLDFLASTVIDPIRLSGYEGLATYIPLD